MKRLFTIAGLFVLALAAGGVSAQNDPFNGTWKLNSSKSKYTTGAPPKEQTVTITTVGDQSQVEVTGTSVDGSPIHVKYLVPTKGGPGKFLMGPFDGVSGKVVNDNTRELSEMKDGKEVTHLTSVLSKDGKTIRVTVKGVNVQGKPVAGVSVYEKQ